jgi:hypothetical protein
MINDPAMRTSVGTLYEPSGNHGFGLVVGHGEGYMVLGIRKPTTQGNILSITNRPDMDRIIELLTKARDRAWPMEKTK